MGNDRRYEWASPSIAQAIHGGEMVSSFYGKNGTVKLDEEIQPDDLTDAEAEERLLELTDGVLAGTITTHEEIARKVRTLGYKLGSMGSVSTEIDVAAYHLAKAIYAKQSTFQEG